MWRQDLLTWMVNETLGQFERAGQLQRRLFQMGRRHPVPCWEPSVDIIASPRALRVVVALPGVALEQLEVRLAASAIVVRGERPFAGAVLVDEILCLEIPYGHFERRIALPDGTYGLADMQLENGCLSLQLDRLP